MLHCSFFSSVRIWSRNSLHHPFNHTDLEELFYFFFTFLLHYLFVRFSLALVGLCDHYSCSVSVLNQNAFNHLI